MSELYIAVRRNNKMIIMVFSLMFLVFVMIAFLMLSYENNPLIKMPGIAYERIIVQQGDTLWDLASKMNRNADISTLVSKTIKYNNLQSTYILPGQIIYVPVNS
ncbi:MAG: Cell division suppressor protein YneA [Candidatus Dichloromethanomonas elyunquensis]|nr:MAG: Cell division suppressor protein YneA [Candidatus Dichloromethanomonas elyunquensis]